MADDESLNVRAAAGSIPPSKPPKFSLSLGAKKPAIAPLRNKRPHAVLEEDSLDIEQITLQEISTFDKDAKATKKTDRVIQSIPDVDWKQAGRAKRQKSGLPAGAQGQNGATAEEDVNMDEGLPKYGLTVVERTNGANSSQSGITPPRDSPDQEYEQAKPKTADEEALEALKGGRKVAAKAITPPTEDDAFRDSYNYAPPAPTVQEFAATPVDGFGAAILRGYLKKGQTLEDHGYNEDGQDDVAKRRPGLLGLGAKESGLGVELGAWGKGARGQKGEGYVPLGRKNRKTGELLTDDELRAKIEAQKEEEKNQKYVKEGGEERDRKMPEDRESSRKRIEYGESRSSRRDERNDERDSDRQRDRRRVHVDEDDYGRRRERHRNDDRRRHSKDRDRGRDGGRRHHDSHEDNDRDDGRRRRRRSRSAHGHREHQSHHTSRRH